MDGGMISVGLKVEFELYNRAGTRIGRRYTGEILELVDDREVIVFSEWDEPVKVYVPNSIFVSVYFHHPLHGRLRWKGTLLRNVETKRGVRFYINIDDGFDEIQKREYFRPVCSSKAEYCLVKKINDSDKMSNIIPYRTAKTKNISYNGACIIADDVGDIMKNDLVDLVVWLRDALNIKMRCRAVRISEVEISGKRNYELGLTIEDISKEDRAHLTKYITDSTIIG